MGLKDAVDKGDFAAVAAEKNAFVLYNSGSYPSLKQKDKKNEAISATNQIFAAIRAKDKGALKSAYTNYLKTVEMSDYNYRQHEGARIFRRLRLQSPYTTSFYLREINFFSLFYFLLLTNLKVSCC